MSSTTAAAGRTPNVHRSTGWRPAFAAAALAAAHLSITLRYATDWQGDETRSDLSIAFLCAILGLGVALAAIARTGGWSGWAGRVAGTTTLLAILAAAAGAVAVWAEPASEGADSFSDYTMWTLMGALTLAVVVAGCNRAWPIRYRLAVLPLALLCPVALSSFVFTFEWTWWAWNFLAAGSIALAGIVLGRRS
ncbi:hypothetical protein EFK50_19780 [Nocardioides marmoriginsengisoli]|uniref:Uncharacterized protein n=1 Tax=Nocardioides marmoriginsengisoli TaxID=661483 RepID=A0A3N0CAU0_9ACTN|nr:hypothetical protein [Nocardioides marmoriginsengisoli]RNL60560.1 hypothetical protein EFK50_19780 [Nocardioides marmoriginsengisoli]